MGRMTSPITSNPGVTVIPVDSLPFINFRAWRLRPEIKPIFSNDGSQVAVGILYDAVDASAADIDGVAIVRLAELNAAELVWPTGITPTEQTTALAQLALLPGIIVR